MVYFVDKWEKHFPEAVIAILTEKICEYSLKTFIVYG